MPKFKVECDSKHSIKDTFGKVKTFLDTDADIKKLDPGAKITYNEQLLTGNAKGSKFDAEIKVLSRENGAKVEIEVSLPMLLIPIKGMVQASIQKKLKTALS